MNKLHAPAKYPCLLANACSTLVQIVAEYERDADVGRDVGGEGPI